MKYQFSILKTGFLLNNSQFTQTSNLIVANLGTIIIFNSSISDVTLTDTDTNLIQLTQTVFTANFTNFTNITYANRAQYNP